ncbi:hypothetical protein A7D21_26825 [Pseudomonas sp. AP19]|uniref:hypothetical protein n=1 Tax=Pseudomonas sp. AP19 TaxID=1535623 RepID=UPI00084B671D|nr:hypothetical protein [Pseudomonas sp. AP19]OEC62121.1 hypothetical protein A7D21_26825 [Pseudomonas sp. AP19]
MRNTQTREGFEFWDKLNSLPRYAFLLSPSGKSVQKFEDQAMGNWIDVHEARMVIDQAQEVISELRDEIATSPEPDTVLCKFYDVTDWPGLVRELVGHVAQLQESAKRNVKPWEDTFPPTLMPAYVERVNTANAVALPQGEPVACAHDWLDDGEYLIVCTKCGAQENHDPCWRDMATAPTDGTMLRLLVEFEDHSTEDAEQAPTIGANNFDNDGEDVWRFAGWCWSHDHFTEGKGNPLGWLPMLEGPALIPAEQPAPVAVVLPDQKAVSALVTKAARQADLIDGANYYTAAELAAEALIGEVTRLNAKSR